MTVGLLLLAINEGHVIGRALASAKHLCDRITVVVDDRTTDDTDSVAASFGAEVIRRPFPGTIAAARNEAIDLAAPKSDYLLSLDPDDVYEGALPSKLQSDVYQCIVHDHSQRFPRVQIFRSDVGVRYEGVRHEHAVVPPTATVAVAPNLIYRRIGGGNQDQSSPEEKFLAHARDLHAWLDAHPDDQRAVFLIAQSYRDAGRLGLARDWYERRVCAGDASEQRFEAALEVAFLAEHMEQDSPQFVMSAYLRAHELMPRRAEPLFHLACYLREKGNVASAWHFARRATELQMPALGNVYDVEIYEWKALAELAYECWLLGDRASARELLFRIAAETPAYAEWAREQLAGVEQDDPPERAPTW